MLCYPLFVTDRQYCVFSGITTQICKSKVEEIRCPAGRVIQVSSARYGQTKSHYRCFHVHIPSGSFEACFIDMLQTADSWCSGRQACNVSNDENEMTELLGGWMCAAYYKFYWRWYIEIEHHCVEGIV